MLTNGATGILQWFDSSNGKPHKLWVHFTDTSIWKKICIQYKHLYTKNIDKSWTPIFTVDRQFQVGKYRNIRVIRRQFPLKPAAVMTIHKAQGMSIRCCSFIPGPCANTYGLCGLESCHVSFLTLYNRSGY